MQRFQEMGLANASSTRPANLNKPIPNTFTHKRFQLKRMLNTIQVINVNELFLLETGPISEV